MKNDVSDWFFKLHDAWIKKDIQSVLKLLAQEFNYYEDPLDHPLTTLTEVEQAWNEVKDQKIITLSITPLVCTDREGTATFDLMYTDTLGIQHHYTGVYFVRLDILGKATEFRQWWMGS